MDTDQEHIDTIESGERNGAKEVDPNKLIQSGNVLGFERPSGFEAVTNFSVEVCGYVGDGGNVLGYVLRLNLAVVDPLDVAGHLDNT